MTGRGKQVLKASGSKQSNSPNPQNQIVLSLPPNNFKVRESVKENFNYGNSSSAVKVVKTIPLNKNMVLSPELLQQLRNANLIIPGGSLIPTDLEENGNLAIEGSSTSDVDSDSGAIINGLGDFDNYEAIINDEENGNLQEVENVVIEAPPDNQQDHWLKCKELLTTVLRQQTEILLHCRNLSNVANPTVQNILPELPIQTLPDLLHFDGQLKENGELRQQFERRIRKIGGKNIQKAVAAAMSTLMTDELAKECTWTGITENTLRVCSATFASLISEVLQSSHNATKTIAEDRMKDWLRRAGDRIKTTNKQKEKQRAKE